MVKSNMPVLSKAGQTNMPVLSGKQPGAQRASPAVMPTGKTAAPVVSGKQTKAPSLVSRAANVVSGAAKSTAASFSNAGGVLLDAVGTMDKTSSSGFRQAVQESENAARYRKMLSSGTMDDGTVMTDADRRRVEMLAQRAEQRSRIYQEGVEATHEPISRVVSGIYDTADTLAESSAQDVAQAKAGTGSVGSFLVDVGVAGAQMAGDIGAGLLTGGSALVPMAVRSFGGSAQEARRSGADLGKQLVYGAGSAALSAATEKISNVAAPFRKAFGTGVADKLAEKLVRRFGEHTAVQAMQKLSQTAAGRIAASAVGEGSEEFVEAVFQPVLQRATYDPDARFDWSGAVRDAAIGAVLGGIGGAADVGMRGVQGKQNAAPETEAAVSTIKGTARTTRDTMPGTGGTGPVMNAQGEPSQSLSYLNSMIPQGTNAVHEKTSDPGDVDLAAGILSGGEETALGPVRAGRVTTIQHPYQGKMPVQAQKSTAAVTVDSGSVQAAQGRMDSAGRLYGAENGRGFKAALKNAYKALFKPVKNVPVSGVTYEGRPYTVDINNNVPGKVISDPNLTAEKLALLDILPQVVENGEYVGSGAYVQHGSKKKKTVRYDYFETPVTINGHSYIAAFDVEIEPNVNNYRTHKLIKIDLKESSGPDVGPVPTATETPSSPVEGTRPLNFDSTIPQGADSVNEGQVPRRGTGALDTLGVHVAADMGDYTSSMWTRGREEARKKTLRARQQAERRLNPTKAEKRFARGIAEGDYTAVDIPASMDRETVTELADYYTAEESFKGADSVQKRGQEIRQETEDLARKLMGEAEDYAPMPMLVMNEKTPERVMRRLFGEERGEAVNRTYIYPVQQNEAEKIRFMNRMMDAVRTFTDSTGRESPLTEQERAVVQQILEDRFVGETVATMETAQGIRNAAENIRLGKNAGDAAREFSLGTEEKELAQRLARWMDNQELLASGQVDSAKVNRAVEAYSKQYDLFYDAINDFLTAHGYSTIGFIKGYAPHMQKADTQNKLTSALRSLGVNPDAMSLPTSISGLTADYKPGKRWNPHFQTRHGTSTDYDAAAGYESYVSHLADVLYHTDDIARLRGLSRYLRKTYGPEEIANAIDHAEGLRNMDTSSQMEALRDAGLIERGSVLTPQDTRAKLEEHIDKLYKEIGHVTRYGEFVKYIDNYADILAGKQSMADRGMEYTAGRASLNVGNRLVSAFARAQVAGNVSSALNQSAQLAQLLAEVDGKSVARAAGKLVRSTGGRLWNLKATELFDQSDLLTTKKGINYLTADDSALDRYVTALFKPAEIMDGLLSALTVQSKYEQLRSRGMEHAAAMDEANRFATSIMASRAKGSRPLAYESKSLISQMLHMFQVEAVNSWDHIAQDLPRQYRQVAAEHGKKAAGRAVATVAVKGLLSAFFLNRITEAAYGGTPAPFDVLGYLANFFASGNEKSTNAWLADLVDAGWERIFGTPLFGGDDDDDDNREEEAFNWSQAGDDLVYNLLNDVPFVRNAAGLLGLGDQTMPLTNIAEAVEGVGQAAQNAGVFSGEMGGALLTLGGSMLPGGRQVQKTMQGTQTLLDGGRMYGYGENQRMQYPVERDPLNIVQAVLFGNSGLSESRDFYASGETGLSAKQTQLVKEMAAEGADRIEVYDAIQDIRTGENVSEKLELLNNTNLSDIEKYTLYSETITSDSEGKRAKSIRKLLNMGVSWDQITEAYLAYEALDKQSGISAEEKATRFSRFVDINMANSAHKEKIKETFMFYYQLPAEAKEYDTLVESGVSSNVAEELALEMKKLQPEDGKTNVTDLQKYRTVVDFGLSIKEQMNVLQNMMEDTEYEGLMSAYQKGITPEQFISFREGISGITSDKDLAGKTIANSKKRKVMAYIDALDLSNDQKTELYYVAGYKESTLDDAPWYGRPERSWDIIPRLGG